MKSRSTRRISRRSETLRGLAILAALIGAGCSDVLGPQQDDLSAARARWAVAGPENYLFELQRSCFCGPDFLRAVEIQVQSGAVFSAIYVDTQEPIDEPLNTVPTIEDLFDEIQDAIDREAFRLDVVYSEDLGYPLSVSIDFSEMIADEEQSFQVRNFGELLF